MVDREVLVVAEEVLVEEEEERHSVVEWEVPLVECPDLEEHLLWEDKYDCSIFSLSISHSPVTLVSILYFPNKLKRTANSVSFHVHYVSLSILFMNVVDG